MSLREKYRKQVIPAMKEKFGYRNDLAAPKIEKVVINTGVGGTIKDEKALEEITKSLTLIAGQKLTSRRAKKAISAFKIREGMVVGLAVTLRGKRMYDFLERLVSIALPRGRDFRGLSQKSIDKSGNLTIGIKEQIIFPEVSAESAKNIFGFEICVKTTAKTKEEGLELLRLLGFPIKL